MQSMKSMQRDIYELKVRHNNMVMQKSNLEDELLMIKETLKNHQEFHISTQQIINETIDKLNQSNTNINEIVAILKKLASPEDKALAKPMLKKLN